MLFAQNSATKLRNKQALQEQWKVMSRRKKLIIAKSKVF
jgi:hypothetical protein